MYNDTEEFEGHYVPDAAFDISDLEANSDHFYAAYRLLSFYPNVNVKGKTYFPEDISDTVLASAIGVEVDIGHDKQRLIGVVSDAKKTASGIDILARFNRDAVTAQGLTVDDIKTTYNKCSLDLTKDPFESKYLVIDSDLNILQQVSTVQAAAGMRCTTAHDPFLYQGNQVVERVIPVRFRGVGVLNNPADATAQAYVLVASDDKPHNNVEDTVRHEKEKLEMEEIDRLKAELATANAKLQTLETEKASAMSDLEDHKAKLGKAHADLADMHGQMDSKHNEIADLTGKVMDMSREKAERERKEQASANYNTLKAILAPSNDEEEALYQEKASAACDDAAILREFSLDLRSKALDAREAAMAIPAPEPEPKTDVAVELEKPVVTESASAEIKPAVPVYGGEQTNVNDILKSLFF